MENYGVSKMGFYTSDLGVHVLDVQPKEEMESLYVLKIILIHDFQINLIVFSMKDYDRLYMKLEKTGFAVQIVFIMWLRSYLDHTLLVSIGDKRSV